MIDALGSRMKAQYEQRSQTYLPRRTCTIIRLDGKAFHTYTRGLRRPYDQQFMDDMAETARYLCQQIQGVSFAYTQSDEISLLLKDFATEKTEAWFDGNVQKMVSVSASFATAKFNELRPDKIACFDSRVFTIPDGTEVGNYFVWRQADATRNSISMAAQAYFSHKQLHQKSSNEMQEMLWQEYNVNWNDYDPRFKNGTMIVPELKTETATFTHKKTGEVQTTTVEQKVWTIQPAENFRTMIGLV